MTFDSAAWAINGPEIGAALARRAQYAGSRQSGIIQKNDLKVRQLATPGVGIIIDEGVGVVLNGYQNAMSSGVNEAYVVNNPGAHTVPSGEMPASNPAPQSYIVAIVVGDPDFDNTGHPFMPSTGVPTGEESTYQYVRPVLIACSAGATSLNVNYPALVLARIDVPASTTTITDAMIHDLRKLANPRQEQQIFVGQPWTNGSPVYIPSGSAYGDWGPGQFKPSVDVPSWAKRAIMVVSINGIKVNDSTANISGGVRTQFGSVSGPATGFDIDNGSTGAIRLNLQTAGEYNVSGIAGTTVDLRVEGYENVPASPTTNQRLALRNGSQMIFDVRFFEE